MKTTPECMPCFLQQTLRVAKMCGCSVEKREELVRAVAGIIADIDFSLSPPAAVEPVYDKIAEFTGNVDPYWDKKIESNHQAKKIVEKLSQELEEENDPLPLLIRFVITGNIMDYGVFDIFDLAASLDKSREFPLAVDDLVFLRKALAAAKPGCSILYLADNAGEIVYDSLFVRYLKDCGFNVTLAVKDGPIINDALIEDALFAGIQNDAQIITNGTRCPGTVLDRCTEEFKKIFYNADIVISKGMGNFESLSDCDRDIFFLFTVKCQSAARFLEKLRNLPRKTLPANGEMVLYYYKQNNLQN